MVVYAIFEFGIMFKNYLALTDAVREGARVAIVSRTQTDPVGTTQDAVVAAAADLNLPKSNVQVTPAATPTPWQPASDVSVTATYPYTLQLFGIPVISGNLTSSTTVRVE